MGGACLSSRWKPIRVQCIASFGSIFLWVGTVAISDLLDYTGISVTRSTWLASIAKRYCRRGRPLSKWGSSYFINYPIPDAVANRSVSLSSGSLWFPSSMRLRLFIPFLLRRLWRGCSSNRCSVDVFHQIRWREWWIAGGETAEHVAVPEHMNKFFCEVPIPLQDKNIYVFLFMMCALATHRTLGFYWWIARPKLPIMSLPYNHRHFSVN